MNIGVRSIVIKGDAILLVAHKSTKGEFFLLPGGGVENEESLFKAAEREVIEETNSTVTAKKIVGLRQTKYAEKYGLEIYIVCDYISGEVSLGMDPEHSSENQILTHADFHSIHELKFLSIKPEGIYNFLQHMNPTEKGIVDMGLDDLSGKM